MNPLLRRLARAVDAFLAHQDPHPYDDEEEDEEDDDGDEWSVAWDLEPDDPEPNECSDHCHHCHNQRLTTEREWIRDGLIR